MARDACERGVFNGLWLYAENGEIVSRGTVLFCPPKHFKFIDPGLKIRLEGDEIAIFASAYAKSVEIRNENDDLILSDNFFDMNGGERRVKIIKGDPEGLSVRSVYNIGRKTERRN